MPISMWKLLIPSRDIRDKNSFNLIDQKAQVAKHYQNL